MEIKFGAEGRTKKPSRPTERPMTTPLFLLRCLQVGLSMKDLDDLDIGLVNDMFVEKANDQAEWHYKATQADMDAL